MKLLIWLLLAAFLVFMGAPTASQGLSSTLPAGIGLIAPPLVSPLEELRYCGKPERDVTGQIRRSTEVLKAFKLWHPCPSTGRTSGSCPGWAMDHVIPLACGGCDSVTNLQWLPNDIKARKDAEFERKIYGAIPPIPDTANCVTPRMLKK